MNDYHVFLNEVGYSESAVRAISENEADRINIDADSVYLADSAIEGTGLFLSGDVEGGEVVIAALLDGMRTQAGRYGNHSREPNSRMQFIGDDVYLVAIDDIQAGEELTTSYRDTHHLMSSYSKEEFREGIVSLEKYMKDELSEHHIDPEINHFFADGMYGRQMTLNAGDVIVGKIHKQNHIVVISKGSGYVISEVGMMQYKAPFTFVSEAGTKRTIKAEEETVWMTVHATEETDLDKIEAEVIAPNYESLGGTV